MFTIIDAQTSAIDGNDTGQVTGARLLVFCRLLPASLIDSPEKKLIVPLDSRIGPPTLWMDTDEPLKPDYIF
jgi:hypothetical protein